MKMQISNRTKRWRVGLLSLGCPKTLVDSELILGKLDPTRYDLAPAVADCDVALLNTCAFIEDAQRESIDHILELVELKKRGNIGKLIVMGCLTQRFAPQLEKEIKEVDAFVGSGEYAKIPDIVEEVLGGREAYEIGVPGYLYTSSERRVSLTPVYTRYLKISEGCDHSCSFCVIPAFRGRYRSRDLEDVVHEAGKLVREGARELVLTGQDTTFFGYDREGKYLLPELLRRLNSLPDALWIRILYAYPSLVTDELIEAVASLNKVCRYLDVPLQHVNDRILKSMRRGTTSKTTRRLIERLRQGIPGVSLRTTFIVGYPGETDGEFQELLEFMEWARFDRLGVFTYSAESGSAAAALSNPVAEKTKQKRLRRAMELQQRISLENNRRLKGQTVEVLAEGKEKDPGWYVGRSSMDAPEVDGSVFFHVPAPNKVEIGEFVSVKIQDTREYDLVGSLIDSPSA